MEFPLQGPYPVFVYGTLKPGGFYYGEYCAGRVTASIPAMIRGWIYHLPAPGYPAVVVPKGLDELAPWVHGYVHWIEDRAVAERLDELEGYRPLRPAEENEEENEYARVRIPAFDLSGDPFATAWTYVMSRERVEAIGGIVVTSGNWHAGVAGNIRRPE